jgi:hypothetical protein
MIMERFFQDKGNKRLKITETKSQQNVKTVCEKTTTNNLTDFMGPEVRNLGALHGTIGTLYMLLKSA